MSSASKQCIEKRFGTRVQAEHYRDRYASGRRRRTHDREVKALQAVLGELGEVKVVLDVGSGAGRFGPLLLESCTLLIQTDISGHMLEVSRESYRLDPCRAAYVRADVKFLPFAESSVDVVICHRLLNHLPVPKDRRLAMHNLARVSGRYVIFSCLGPLAALRTLRRGYQRLRGRASIDGHVEADDLIADAHACGLSLLRRTTIHSFAASAQFFTFTKASISDQP